MVAMAVILCVVLCLSRFLVLRKYQVTLVLFGLVSLVVDVAVSATGLAGTESFAWALLIARGGFNASFLAFWGLSFASLGKENAEETVFWSLLMAFCLYLLLGLVPVGDFGFYAVAALKALSVLPFLANKYTLSVVSRTYNAKTFELMVPFYASRVVIGLCLGAVVSLRAFANKVTLAPSWVPSIVLVAVILAVTAYTASKRKTNRSMVAIAPLLTVGALAAPYVRVGDVAVVCFTVASSAIYLAWTVLASIQLSDLKERAGMSESVLALSEKIVVTISGAFGGFMASALFSSSSNNQTAIDFWLVLALYVALALCSYLAVAVIGNKEKENSFERGKALSESEVELAFERIGDAGSLTAREQEVLGLLAEGHTRAEICERLNIAPGTVQTHISRIYEKLDVHSRQDLLNLVEIEKNLIVEGRSS